MWSFSLWFLQLLSCVRGRGLLGRGGRCWTDLLAEGLTYQSCGESSAVWQEGGLGYKQEKPPPLWEHCSFLLCSCYKSWNNLVVKIVTLGSCLFDFLHCAYIKYSSKPPKLQKSSVSLPLLLKGSAFPLLNKLKLARDVIRCHLLDCSI